jgi:hypothetical protein
VVSTISNSSRRPLVLPSSFRIFWLQRDLCLGKPILIISLIGSDPTAPSILLNSHYDVVPADADLWAHTPFEGFCVVFEISFLSLLTLSLRNIRGREDIRARVTGYEMCLHPIYRSSWKNSTTNQFRSMPSFEALCPPILRS